MVLLRSIFFLLILTVSVYGFAQSSDTTLTTGQFPTYRNGLSLEAGGPSFLYGLHYQRLVWRKQQFAIHASVGASYTGFNIIMETLFLCAEFNGQYELRNRHVFRVGTGISAQVLKAYEYGSEEWSSENQAVLFVPSIGYYYRFYRNRFEVGGRFTPFVPLTNPSGFIGAPIVAWGGISLSYRFGTK